MWQRHHITAEVTQQPCHITLAAQQHSMRVGLVLSCSQLLSAFASAIDLSGVFISQLKRLHSSRFSKLSTLTRLCPVPLGGAHKKAQLAPEACHLWASCTVSLGIGFSSCQQRGALRQSKAATLLQQSTEHISAALSKQLPHCQQPA